MGRMFGRASMLAMLALSACRFGFDERADAGRDMMSPYAAAVLADGPRAYYRLGDAQGLLARDATSNANDAEILTTNTGQVTMGMPGALPGDPDTATYFRGEGIAGNESVATAHFPALWPTWMRDFTLEAFVNPLAPPPLGGDVNSLVVCETY